MAGTTKDLGYERVSCGAWNYETWGWGETWPVIAHVKGTAGNMTEYCWCIETIYNDGTEELEYRSPAHKEDLEKFMGW